MNIHEILFGKNSGLAKNDGALFASQVDLSDAIMQRKGGGFEGKNVGSVRAFVSQALRPNRAKNSRPVSPNLLKALSCAFKERLREGLDGESCWKDAEQALMELKNGEVTFPLSSEEVFSMLTDTAKTATTHFIVTYKPAENTDAKRATEIMELMVERLNLHCQTTSKSEKEVHYIFYLKNKSVAIQFWKKLYSFLITRRRMESDIVKRQLKEVNDVQNKYSIDVYCIDPILCVQPTVVFDPEKTERCGFTLHYHGNNYVSVAMMSKEDLKEWEDEFYLKITTEPKRWGVERVSWDEALYT